MTSIVNEDGWLYDKGTGTWSYVTPPGEGYTWVPGEYAVVYKYDNGGFFSPPRSWWNSYNTTGSWQAPQPPVDPTDTSGSSDPAISHDYPQPPVDPTDRTGSSEPTISHTSFNDALHDPLTNPIIFGPLGDWEWVGNSMYGVWQPVQKGSSGTTPWTPPELVGPRHPVSRVRRDVTDYDWRVARYRRRRFQFIRKIRRRPKVYHGFRP